jgi:Amt family ammonium transporter
VGLWSLAASFLIIVAVKTFAGWRIGREGELQGLDFSSHGEAGYHTSG